MKQWIHTDISLDGDMLAVDVAVGKTSKEQAVHIAVIGNFSLKLSKPAWNSGPCGGIKFVHTGLQRESSS